MSTSTTTQLNEAIRAAGVAGDALYAAEETAARLRQRARTKHLALLEARLWPEKAGEAQVMEERYALAITEAGAAERNVQIATVDWNTARDALNALLPEGIR